MSSQATSPVRVRRVLGLALAVTSFAGPLHAQDTNLRVLVFDIASGRDTAGRGNLARVAEIIRNTNADVVLLQSVEKETRRAWDIDQVQVLSRITGLHGSFHATGEAGGGQTGLAVLSRWEAVTDSAADSTAFPPGAFALEIDRPGGALWAMTVQVDTSLTDDQAVRRIGEVRAAAEARGAAMLGGHFHAVPGNPAIVALKAAGWTDAWAQCGGEEPAAPRVDYLFLAPGLRCVEARVIETDASRRAPLLVVIG